MTRKRKRRANQEAFESAFAAVPTDTYKHRVLAHLADVYSAIRPLAWLDSKRRLNFVGSSLLFEVGTTRLLVTAAHVLDEEARHGPLHVATPAGQTTVGGLRRWTQAPDGDRDADPFDLGFVVLDPQTSQALASCRHLTLEDVDPSLEDPELPEDCLAIGFPGNWVSHSDPATAVATPMFAVGPRLKASEHQGLGVAEPFHALMGFDKESSVDLEGPRIPPDPFGMSGGGLWRFSSLRRGQEARNRLLGVLIEWRGPTLIATRAGVLLSAIRDLVPGASAELSDAAPPDLRNERERTEPERRRTDAQEPGD
ncbi:hypothetical protein rosag_42890 [Roseisolibacter agri]|uniref:Trypsin n=1 Tax=Roseisolibacter agri TaxID=2014610 RepID=A0AA37V8H2_9BACT|nr:hypothetical protein rosag_42890 [Roseisolibacter agri]